MTDILKLAEIDYWNLFFSICIILLAVKAVIMLFEWFVVKFGLETKGMRQKREEHELLLKNSQGLNTLKCSHEEDIKDLKDCLSLFIEETRKENAGLRNTIKQQDENNLDHWDISKNIRKELTESIKSLVDTNTAKDKQIESLIVAQKEMLSEKINAKYKYYVSIGGIPEDEYDEFVSLHRAYNGVGGNSHGDAKFEYCITHLPVIPVETKLVIRHETL